MLRAVLLTLGLTTLTVGGIALTQEPPQDARERWEDLSEEARAAALERFEQYQGMSEDEREELRERARHVRSLRERVHEHLPPPVRMQLDTLPPHEARALMRDHVREELGAIGRGFREELPPDVRGSLEGAGPDRWPHILHERKRHDRDRGHRGALKHLGRALGKGKDEVDAVAEMPPERREAVLLEWSRESAVRSVEARLAEGGELPPGIDEATWQKMQSLSDGEFLSELRRTTGYGAFAPRRPERGGRGPGGRGHEGRGPFFDPFAGHGDDSGRELRDLLRPRMEDKLDLRHLPDGERRERVAALVKGRVMPHLERHRLFPEQLDELRQIEGEAFLDRVHELVRGGGSRPWGPPGGDFRRGEGGGGPGGRRPR